MATETRIRMSAAASILREQGLTWREIGERMGISLSYAHQLVSDPDDSQRNAQRRKPQPVGCAMCGAPLAHAKGKGARKTYCGGCVVERHRAHSRRRWDATRDIRNARRRRPEERERHRASARRYYAANRKAIRASRIAARIAPSPRSTPPEYPDLMVLFNDPCSYCGGDTNTGIDHIVPIARGGGGEIENLTAACVPCNRTKNDQPLLVYLARKMEA